MGLTFTELVEDQNEAWQYEFRIAPMAAGEFGNWRQDLVADVSPGMEPKLFGNILIKNVEVIRNGAKLRIAYVECDPSMQKDDGGEPVFEEQLPRFIELEMERFRKATRYDLDALQDNPLERLAMTEWARTAGTAANEQQNYYFWEVVLASTGTAYGPGFDGQPLFDTDHPVKLADGSDGVQSNYFNLALTKDNLKTVVETMNTYRTADNRALGSVWVPGSNKPSFRLYYGPSLATTVAEILQPDPNAQNVLHSQFTAHPVHPLQGEHADKWFVAPIRRGNARCYPFYFANGGRTLHPPSEHDQSVRHHQKAEFIAWARWGLSPGHWHEMAMSDPTP